MQRQRWSWTSGRVFLFWLASAQADSVLDPTPELGLDRYYGAGSTQTLVPGPESFPQAVRVQVPARTPNAWDLGAKFPVKQGLSAGEPLRFVFWSRCTGAGSGEITWKIEKVGEEGQISTQQTHRFSGNNWVERSVNIAAPPVSLPVPKAAVALFFGSQAQDIELAGVRLERASPCFPLELVVMEWLGGGAESATFADADRGCFERVVTTSRPTDPWGVQLVQPWRDVVRSGDWLAGAVTVRRSPGNSQPAQLELVFQRSSGDYGAAYSLRVAVESEVWQEVPFCFKTARDFNASSTDGAQFVINLGFGVQSVDLSGFRLQNLGAFPASSTMEQFTLYSEHPGDLRAGHMWDGSSSAPFLRVETTRLPDNWWEGQVQYGWPDPIAKDDVFAGSVRVRRSPGTTGDAALVLHLQHQNWKGADGDPHRKVASFGIPVDSSEWRTVSFAFRADEPLNYSGSTRVQWVFDVGFGPQSVDVTELVITNLGKNVDLGSLPNDFTSYQGREPGAGWRRQAEADIEKYRKGDFVLDVRDQHGRVLSGIPIHARLSRHEFAFGGSVKAEEIVTAGGNQRTPRIRNIVTNWFNRVVFENDLKWGPWLDSRTVTTSALAWLEAQGLPVRGHTLVWPIKQSPAASYATPGALLSAVNQHVADEAGHAQLRGRLREWDVVNEPTYYEGHADGYGGLYADLTAFLGALAQWYELARRADPGPIRFINEFGVLEEPGLTGRKMRLHQWIQSLRGVDPTLLGGIGLQAHLTGHYLMSPERLLRTFDEFYEAYQIPIQITELDVATDDEALQADYTRDLLTAAFSHPGVSGVMLWMWFPGSGWRGNASLFRSDWSPKPNGLVFSNLVHRIWHTEVGGVTDAAGRLALRGFRGEYEVVAEVFGDKITNRANFTLPGVVPIAVVIPPPTAARIWPTKITGNGIDLRFSGSSGRRYRVETTPVLGGTSWVQVAELTAPPDGEVVVTLTRNPGQPIAFYRVVSVP